MCHRQINNASSLLMLGSLIIGVPANTFSNIDGSEVIAASKDPTFLMHLTTAPRIIQLVVVSQVGHFRPGVWHVCLTVLRFGEASNFFSILQIGAVRIERDFKPQCIQRLYI